MSAESIDAQRFGPLDVLLVIRACAEQYPPTVNQANFLAGTGLRVGLVHLASGASKASGLSAAVNQCAVHRAWDSKTEPPPPLPRRWHNWLSFSRACRAAMRYGRPKLVIGYDPAGCVHLKPAPGPHSTIYHFHELPESERAMGTGLRWALGKVRRYARRVDLVVFSDAMRARAYQQEAKLPAPPQIVMNCPARLEAVPNSPLPDHLACQGLSAGQTVCYLGSIGVNQGLPEAALSMRYWPADAVFVLIGGYSESMQQNILAKAQAVNAASRVVFLGPRPHGEALALTAGADLGLSLIQPTTRNLLYSAGAINKRFEYMALGLPQVTNSGPGVAEIIEGNQCGLCVDPGSPEAIGQAVSRLLSDEDLRRRLGQQGRESHLERYNYEGQFAPVREWIQGAVRESAGRGVKPGDRRE